MFKIIHKCRLNDTTTLMRFDAPAVGLVPPIKDVALGDAAAFAADDGVLTLMLVQRDTAKEQTFTVELPAEYVCLSAQRLYHEDCFAFNRWMHPEDVVPQELEPSQVQIAGSRLTITCPAVSLTKLQLRRA